MRFVLIFILFFTGVIANAQHSFVTTSPYPVTVEQPDGSNLIIYGKGDERNHYSVSEDGYTVIRNHKGIYEYARINKNGKLDLSGIKARNISERKPVETEYLNKVKKFIRQESKLINQKQSVTEDGGPQKVFPKTGNRKTLMLMIKYPDLADTYTTGVFNNFMNQTNYNGTGSFRDYFLNVSDNNLSMSVDVYGWYVAANNYEYYGDVNGDSRAQELVAEAIDAAEAAGVDFSQYDNDGNGQVDNLFVVHSGRGAEEGSQTEYIWSHSWSLGGLARNYDGVSISPYIIMPETRSYGMVGIGVFCHEFGHALGLPDLYDTNTDNGDSEGLGNWCLMASGAWLNQEKKPAMPSAWNRAKLGWISPVEISAQGSYSLNPSATSTDCYKILTSKSNEYFLLENRYKTGVDAYLPGSGLAIYHINSNKSNNADEDNKVVDLEEADGNNDLDNTTNRGDSGDLFPGSSGNTTFNDLTNPDAKNNDGTLTGISLSNIQLSGSTINFDLGAGIEVGNDLTYDSLSNALAINSTQVDIDLKLKNIGTQNAGSFKVAFYLSSNSVINTSDYLLGTTSLSSLNAGATSNKNFTIDAINVVPEIPPGNYYVGYLVDYLNAVTELDENNNEFAFTAEQLQILASPNLTFDTRQNNINISGFDVSVDLRVENNGNTSSGACKIGFYISKNNPVNTGDLFIGEVALASINSGGSANKSFSANVIDLIPNLAAGNYYIGYVIDYENVVNEKKENDNSYTFTSKRIDNYFISNLTYDSGGNSLNINETNVAVNLKVKNTGDLASTDCTVGFYVSKYNPVNSNDHFIGDLPLGVLTPGQSESLIFSADIVQQIPNLSAGDYYVGYVIDNDEMVPEDNENDNTFTFNSVRVTIAPNLTFNSNSNQLEISITEIGISHQVKNTGRTNSGISTVAYYLSTDNTINASDYLLGEKSINNLDIDELSNENFVFDITLLDGKINKGSYYVGYILDYDQNIDELDESDNNFVFGDVFNYCPPDATVFYETICEGERVTFRDSVYKTDGVYEFTFAGQSGCDSVIVFDLTVNAVSELVIDKFICYGETAFISNIEYSESGTYTEVFTNVLGCDSAVVLNLVVGEPVETVLNESICEGSSFEAAGKIYMNEGTYINTLQNQFGCDSTVILNLAVYPKSQTLLTEIICEGDSIIVGNSVHKKSGVYSEMLSNIYGCDSLVTLNLTVNPIYEVFVNKTICSGDSIFIGPFLFKETGVYTNTFDNRFGCDSTVILNLTVNPVNDTLLEVILCEGESIQIGNSVYNETGIYVDNLLNKYGCDSIVALNLIVNPVHETLLEKIICEGESVSIGTSVYNSSGSYTNILTNQFGCDSTVYLNLTVNPVHFIEIQENICQGAEFLFGGSYYSGSGDYEHLFQNIFGCDSIVVLHLNVVPLPVVDLGEDFEMFSSETEILDAGAGFSIYNWSTGENSYSIVINNSKGLGKKNYSVTVTNEHFCTGSDEINITIYDDLSAEGDKEPLLKVFPNPTQGNVNLLIEQITGMYFLNVYNESGNIIYQKEFSSSGNKFVKYLNFSQFPPGIYMVQIISGEKNLVERFIIKQN